jgi:hypothetical protein
MAVLFIYGTSRSPGDGGLPTDRNARLRTPDYLHNYP